MAWIATDEDGKIALYVNEPIRQDAKALSLGELAGYWTRRDRDDGSWCVITKCQSDVLIGKLLTWEDEPVELK